MNYLIERSFKNPNVGESAINRNSTLQFSLLNYYPY